MLRLENTKLWSRTDRRDRTTNEKQTKKENRNKRLRKRDMIARGRQEPSSRQSLIAVWWAIKDDSTVLVLASSFVQAVNFPQWFKVGCTGLCNSWQSELRGAFFAYATKREQKWSTKLQVDAFPGTMYSTAHMQHTKKLNCVRLSLQRHEFDACAKEFYSSLHSSSGHKELTHCSLSIYVSNIKKLQQLFWVCS